MNSKSGTTGRAPLGKRRNDESIGKQNMTVSFETTPLLQLFTPSSPDHQEPPTQDDHQDLEDDPAFPVLMHRDSDFTIGSAYSDEDVHNDLSMWRGSLLITAEMMGTGLLALPFAIHTLGTVWGIGFLILNLPINWYAGWILHQTAAFVERQQAKENAQFSLERLHLGGLTTTPTTNSNNTNNSNNHMAMNQNTMTSVLTNLSMEYSVYTHHTQIHHDTATFDFIGITDAVFQSKALTRLVMTIYYTNIFLVLGNYILVMSHSVAAAIGEDLICLPIAGLLASTGMFVVSQSRTMAKLGRTASMVSLTVLFFVVLQCLWEVRQQQPQQQESSVPDETTATGWAGWLKKLSATGSIGFACGSSKLFLNVRHELVQRKEAPQALGLSIGTFGTCYVLICLLAGPNPPAFLFDAIPRGSWNRHVAGVFLWIHVVVSYAINSQAICSSMDRLLWSKYAPSKMKEYKAATRWFCLTLLMAVSAYCVANAIPFFKDLVSLIGALTAVPLTLVMPALLWRRHLQIPLFGFTKKCLTSSGLLNFSIVFMTLALLGCVYEIQQDWSNHGAPFSCQ